MDGSTINPKTRPAVAATAIAIYLASVILANWLTTRYGFIHVGFGTVATAGTFAAGGALVVRDIVQDATGRAGTFALILTAAALSFLVSAHPIALASGAAFLTAETLDMIAYTPLRKRSKFGGPRWQIAVAAGALIGAIADTVMFLWIAFGWAAIAPRLNGQLIGKTEVVAVFIICGLLARRQARPVLDRPATA